MSSSLPQKVIDQIARMGLPTGGQQQFRPKVVRNRRGELIIEKRKIVKGPGKGEKGYLDDQGRIWIKDRAHAGVPDHWDVQVNDGDDYFRVGLDGHEVR